MKASEITQPGLYWACGKGADGVRTVVNVAAICGALLMEWHGEDDADDLRNGGLKQIEDFDFIGPFPPPGEGPKFEGFKQALEALCQAWGVQLSASMHDALEVWDAGKGEEPLHFPSVDDRTHEGRLLRAMASVKD